MGANFWSSLIGVLASLDSLNIDAYFSLVSFIGTIFPLFKKEKLKIIEGIICGLGMIFIGLSLMKESCEHDSFKNVLRNTLEKIYFPLALLLLGLVFSALIKSSSAMTGLIIVMVQGGSMNMKRRLFIIGSNIGTSPTAIISTIGKSVNTRRTRIIHLIFKIFRTLVFTLFTLILDDEIINILEKLEKLIISLLCKLLGSIYFLTYFKINFITFNKYFDINRY